MKAYVGLGALSAAAALAFGIVGVLGHHLDANTVNSGGSGLLLNQPPGTAWLRTLASAYAPADLLLLVAAVAHQVISYRRAIGVRRQQLKSLTGGVAVCLLAIVALGSGSAAPGSSPLSPDLVADPVDRLLGAADQHRRRDPALPPL